MEIKQGKTSSITIKSRPRCHSKAPPGGKKVQESALVDKGNEIGMGSCNWGKRKKMKQERKKELSQQQVRKGRDW